MFSLFTNCKYFFFFCVWARYYFNKKFGFCFFCEPVKHGEQLSLVSLNQESTCFERKPVLFRRVGAARWGSSAFNRGARVNEDCIIQINLVSECDETTLFDVRYLSFSRLLCTFIFSLKLSEALIANSIKATLRTRHNGSLIMNENRCNQQITLRENKTKLCEIHRNAPPHNKTRNQKVFFSVPSSKMLQRQRLTRPWFLLCMCASVGIQKLHLIFLLRYFLVFVPHFYVGPISFSFCFNLSFRGIGGLRLENASRRKNGCLQETCTYAYLKTYCEIFPRHSHGVILQVF